MTQIIAVAVQKGGTGKTTTAAALAQAAVYRKKKVLAIDLDPQGNLSAALGADPGHPGNSYSLLTGADPGQQIQTTGQGLDVIRAAQELVTITSSKGSARRLQRALLPIKENYDVIVLDVPTAGELQYNALQAATDLIIPAQADTYSIQSLYQTVDIARQIQTSNPDLFLTGCIITMYDNRATVSKQLIDAIQERAEGLNVPYLGRIRKGAAVIEAAGLQRSLYTHASHSNPARDYLKVFDKIGRK